MIKCFLTFIALFYLSNCSEKTIYSGKILNQDNFTNINFINKKILLENMGQPSFIDPIENKYFYFSEKRKKKSFFKKNTEYSYIFVFEFDKDNNISKSKVYDLANSKNIKFIEEETESNIIKRGLIEKIFGGVGPRQEIPTTP